MGSQKKTPVRSIFEREINLKVDRYLMGHFARMITCVLFVRYEVVANI